MYFCMGSREMSHFARQKYTPLIERRRTGKACDYLFFRSYPPTPAILPQPTSLEDIFVNSFIYCHALHAL